MNDPIRLRMELVSKRHLVIMRFRWSPLDASQLNGGRSINLDIFCLSAQRIFNWPCFERETPLRFAHASGSRLGEKGTFIA